MGNRNRVMSFMSSFSNRDRDRDSQNGSPQPTSTQNKVESYIVETPVRQDRGQTDTSSGPPQHASDMGSGESPLPRTQRERAPSRPMSMVHTYQPALMDVNEDTLPELQPIFTFLNSHSNKLYQEGYFLKLDDQNTQGRANADRTWTECFAQLVGTVLSLWDATELDSAGQDGEVLPKFINLTDASIKMIESLPTRSVDEAPLQNVLSVSTAGKNRYLLHFNSHHSLIQWTAGIRLAMFEHATLQEAYTGALIAGKGKSLNNINVIMERARLKTEDWARVRFGAGTPWRRCWCVITPPDEKEVQKLQKQMGKKKSAYDRSRPMVLKGDIKFYDSKKTKKVQPIATITDAYSAFAIYPQSKPLIEASTLVKVEGSITIHSNPPSTTEGFVFVMPEVHPAVSGFEMMLRWLFPVFDIFALYGRPGRLIADTTNPQSLMFAMPKHRRYGYLEILDVSGLILEPGSTSWRESEWRRRMKDLTEKRMTAIENSSRTNSRYGSTGRRSTRNSFGPSRSKIQFDDGASVRSSPSGNFQGQGMDNSFAAILRIDSAPPGATGYVSPPKQKTAAHFRSVSVTQGLDRYAKLPSYDGAYDSAPTPPPHSIGVATGSTGKKYRNDLSTPERLSSEDDYPRTGTTPIRELQELATTSTPEPVAAPPVFMHAPGTKLPKPYYSPELRRANSRMSNATLSQLTGVGGTAASAASAAYAAGEKARTSEDQRRQMGRNSEERSRGVLSDAEIKEYPANHDGLFEGLVAVPRFPLNEQSSSVRTSESDTRNDFAQKHQFFPSSTSSTQFVTDPSTEPRGLLNESSSSRTYDPPHIVTISSNSNSQAAGSQPASMPSHTLPSSADANTPQPHRLQTSQSILRKPLPSRPTSFQTPQSDQTPSSTGSLGQHVIDQAAFDLITARSTSNSGRIRGNSSDSSVYDAPDSTLDYASTMRPSIDTRSSVEKPRAGVMRTVGTVDENQTGSIDPSSMINIDFGPTLNLASDRAPRSKSPGPMQSYGQDRLPRKQSPGPAQSYSTAQPARYASPGPGLNNPARPDSAGHSRSPSRTLAWQPGMGSVGPITTAKGGLTADQFVQQRAAAAINNPQYVHQRQASGNALNTTRTQTPPLVRNRSSDLLYQQGHSRNSSTDMLQRPSSRGAASTLGDINSSLSAKEQEHVSRMTGQPLVNMAQNNRASVGSGLVGAIEAREKDKQQMKAGLNSQAVQHAIAQRQQHAMYQQQEFRAPQYGNMGQYPQQYPVQSHQQWGASPAANVYAQGGGWSAPTTPYRMPETGRQSPSMQQYQQQQYFPPQQGQGGRGYYQGQH